MRVLVIGGTGFIGSHVLHSLAAVGHEVAVFHRGRTPLPRNLPVSEVLGDRRDLLNLADAWKAFAPDVVLDMIPATEDDARVLMATFRGITRRVVAVSSADVYRAFGRLQGVEPGPPEPIPITEESPLRGRLYPYRGERLRPAVAGAQMDDYEKILVERTVMGDREVVGTVLRLAAVYGPGDALRRLHFLVKRMVDQRPAILLDEFEAGWRWPIVYVENAASAIALAVTHERAAGRIYNVAEPDAPSRLERTREIAEAFGWKGRIVIVPESTLPPHLKVGVKAPLQDFVLDTTRIRKELGYVESVGRVEGLRNTVMWEVAHVAEVADSRIFDYETEDAVLAARG